MKIQKILVTWLLACALGVSFTHSTNAASFTGLGDLPGGQFDSGLRLGAGTGRGTVIAISRDGSVVVGTGTSAQNLREAFRWTLDSGMVGLGNLLPPGAPVRPNPIGPFSSTASGVNANGDVVVGYSVSETTDHQEAYRWTQETGMTALGFLDGFEPRTSRSRPQDVSDDGSIIVGVNHAFGSNIIGSDSGAFRWTKSDGMVDLGGPPEFTGWERHEANLISGDGAVIVGASSSGSPLFERALWRWTKQAGFSVFDQSPSALRSSSATDITPDGSVIVGSGGPANDPPRFPPRRPFRWTEESGLVDLDGWVADVFGSVVNVAVTDDGATIVGSTNPFNDSSPNAVLASFIWDEQHGMRHLSQVLASEHGLAGQMGGWKTLLATDISGDGRRIVGHGVNPQGFNEAWIAILQAVLPRGDFNGNGLVEQADLNLVLQIWGQPASAAPSPWINDRPTGTIDQNELDSVVLNWPSASGPLNLTLAGSTSALNAKFDLKNNDATFQSTAANKSADLSKLHNQLKQGFNNGDWKGQGITSSTAAANTNNDTALALIDNALLGYTTFFGQPVTADSILLKYTYYGDIDANGQVDADDLTVFANNFGRTSGATQIDGDIDFNGAVNADDLTVFANNFLKGVGNPLGAANVQAVPEPSTLLLAVAIIAISLCELKRTSSRQARA